MVFQNPENQLIAAVVEEDVAFGPENLGLPPEKIRERVRWALEVSGLGKMARKPVYALSGGQKQRLALAGAIAQRTPCLVMDEGQPLLDPGEADSWRYLSSFIPAAHDPRFITHSSRRILCSDAASVLYGAA